jgi:hypothetical protein
MYALEFAYAIFAFANLWVAVILRVLKRLENTGSIWEDDMPKRCSLSVERHSAVKASDAAA